MLKASGSIESRMLISERTLALFVLMQSHSRSLCPLRTAYPKCSFAGPAFRSENALSKEIYYNLLTYWMTMNDLGNFWDSQMSEEEAQELLERAVQKEVIRVVLCSSIGDLEKVQAMLSESLMLTKEEGLMGFSFFSGGTREELGNTGNVSYFSRFVDGMLTDEPYLCSRTGTIDLPLLTRRLGSCVNAR